MTYWHTETTYTTADGHTRIWDCDVVAPDETAALAQIAGLAPPRVRETGQPDVRILTHADYWGIPEWRRCRS